METEDPEEECLSRRVVLIGKTGSGKSSTCNTIFDKKVMAAGASPNSLTFECQSHEGIAIGHLLTVCDTPGAFDTRLNQRECNDKIINFISTTFPGPHAIIMVIKASNRFGKEDEMVLDTFKDLLGEEVFGHMMILFTGLDDLEADAIHPEDYLQNAPTELQSFIASCKGRYLFFNNRAKDSEREMQVKKLLQMIEDILAENGNSHYTNQMYIAADRILKQKLREKEEQLKAEQKKHEAEITHEVEKKYEEKITILKCEMKDGSAESSLKIKEMERKMQEEISNERKTLFEKYQSDMEEMMKQQRNAENRQFIISTLKDVGIGLLKAIPEFARAFMR